VLGRLASSASSLDPATIVVNASRCPDLVVSEIERSTGRECLMMFEPRPLGVCGTLRRLRSLVRGGDWLVLNTDMVTDLDIGSVLETHRGSGACWTAVTGDFPPEGTFGALKVGPDGGFPYPGGRPRHYWGVSILGSAVIDMAGRTGASGLFGELAGAVRASGMGARAVEASGEWLDTGTVPAYRRNLLGRGSFVHPGAVVEDGAVLSGSWFVSEGCRIAAGCVLRNSVMLPGSRLEHGTLEDGILAWMESRSDP
jgi:mannose-1-phosphate guanylyltransferase